MGTASISQCATVGAPLWVRLVPIPEDCPLPPTIRIPEHDRAFRTGNDLAIRTPCERLDGRCICLERRDCPTRGSCRCDVWKRPRVARQNRAALSGHSVPDNGGGAVVRADQALAI